MYNSIHLNSGEINHYNTSSNKEITNLSKINIFIGPNNSGKSKFLRGLFSNENVEFKTEEINLEKINKKINKLHDEINLYYENAGIERTVGFNLNDIKTIDFVSKKTNLNSQILNQLAILSSSQVTSITKKPGVASHINHSQITQYVQGLARKCHDELNFINSLNNNILIHKHIYIPTLRGLRAIDYDENNIVRGADNYLIRTKHDYFRGLNEIEDRIYTGLSLYEDVKKLLLGSSPDREKIKKFERFISETFFDNKEFTIIPHIDDNAVHVKIGDEDDYPIYKLGEGIQSIIILTYPLFFNKGKKLCVFYEEPDLFLHPGFQRVFIETLNKFPEFQFFMTTHSNHFLDMTLDFNSISIYTFRKNEKKEFFIENVKNDDLNILELLGVKNSSVFLSNCTIWVEGITDRIYLRRYLDLYQQTQDKVYSEDIHFSFVEYGGGNITHWSFLEDSDSSHKNIDVRRLCGKLFLISDQDGAEKNKKAKRHIELNKKLKERYYCLKAREIENLLPANAIISTLKALNSKDCEKISFIEIIHDKYKNEPLGEYIDKNVKGLSRKYKADSGTIKYKVEFAKVSISQLNDFNELTDEAKSVTKKLYNFIQKNNPK